jgi:hypothetical protein
MKINKKMYQGHPIYWYETKVARYGKNQKGYYRIELRLDFGLFNAPLLALYQGTRKPAFRNLYLISLLSALSPIVILLLVVSFFSMVYAKGFISHCKGQTRSNESEFFGWINIIVIVVLLILISI